MKNPAECSLPSRDIMTCSNNSTGIAVDECID